MFRSASSRFTLTLGVSLLAFVLALVDPTEADLDSGAGQPTPTVRR